MQKKLIALAVAGLVSAPAFAQSNVTVYGIADLSLKSYNGRTESRIFKVDSNAWSTSRFGVKGNEDLGNGLTAFFQLEYGLTPDEVSGIGSKKDGSANARDTVVGLKGAFGSAKLGRMSTPWNDYWGLFDQNVSNAFSSVYVPGFDGYGVWASRVDSAVSYTTPSFAGLTGTVMLAADENNDTLADKNGASLIYKNGPLALGYIYQQGGDDAEEPSTRVRGHAFGGAYDFGAVKVTGMYKRAKPEASLNEDGDELETQKDWGLGIVVPVTKAGTFTAGYSRVMDNGGMDGYEGKNWSVTYMHALSKRTQAYAGYNRQRLDKDVDGAKNDNLESVLAVGVRHIF